MLFPLTVAAALPSSLSFVFELFSAHSPSPHPHHCDTPVSLNVCVRYEEVFPSVPPTGAGLVTDSPVDPVLFPFDFC